MLLIGSTRANVGKTELACAVISKFSQNREIIGIKVTTIKAKDGKCPRGGTGCGVCSSLKDDFCITEETCSTSGKDTARLLAAGASRVFWLRVMKESLTEGINTLFEIIPTDTPLVCESNSLRHVVQPGLFFIVTTPTTKKWKASAKSVKQYADRIIISDGSSFNIDIERIKLIDTNWILHENATAIILAGGDSSRMGADKSMLPIKGKALIEHICTQLSTSFTEILISAADPNKYGFLGFKVIPDQIPNQGPLMGIASALEASANDLNFITACDIPNLPTHLIHQMLTEAKDADIVVPVTGNEKYEPLFAIYHKNALNAVNKVLNGPSRKISDVFDHCKVKFLKISTPDLLLNLNTKAEYEEFRNNYND
jgi:molybdopterin-guanine dinucleotide biosynthesis protein A